ncbi:hypothetical protein M1146_08040 [Patescibacteria group bacterium]|nr:hypothetical protein [Patescibacteria group bacterium]
MEVRCLDQLASVFFLRSIAITEINFLFLVTPDGKYIFFVTAGTSQLIHTYDIAAKTQKELVIAPCMFLLSPSRCKYRLTLYLAIVTDQIVNLYVTDKYFLWMCKCTGPYQWKAVAHALDGKSLIFHPFFVASSGRIHPRPRPSLSDFAIFLLSVLAAPTVIFTGAAQERALDYGNPNSAIENIYDKSKGYLVWRTQLASGQGYKLYSYKLGMLLWHGG